ncbi:hypothetical protein PYCC9005_004955 [Savitreella phatthalungensis]
MFDDSTSSRLHIERLFELIEVDNPRPDAVGRLRLEIDEINSSNPAHEYTARDIGSYRVEKGTFNKDLDGTLGIKLGLNAAMSGHAGSRLTVINGNEDKDLSM